MKKPPSQPAQPAEALLPANTTRRRTLAALMACAPLGAVSLAGCGNSNGGNYSQTPSPPPPPPPGPPVNGPAWPGYGGNVQHTANGAIATLAFGRIRWSTPVDLAPQYTAGGALLIHYGSPVISGHNTVLVSVKTGATGGFRIEARDGFNGVQKWSAASDYLLPAHNWVPSFGATLTAGNTMVMPLSGGRLFYRDDVDNATGATRTAVFYGAGLYAANAAAFDTSLLINTPITVDAAGTAYFGFIVSATIAAAPTLVSGIARVASDGTGTWVGAAAAAGDAAIGQVAMSCAPALSNDGATLYVAVNTPRGTARQTGYLLALNSTTLATQAAVLLRDPSTNAAAWVSENATSSPTVGPDGDVYYGVLGSTPDAHNFRGWLLHWDSTLATTKTPGSFGWDITPSIVPKTMVPGYSTTSPYLIATKYNNYFGAGTGDGVNKIAILDPNVTQNDPITNGVAVMKEVLTKAGPTIDPGKGPNSVKEWCINTAAVDPLTRSVLVNNEDGKLYRWDLPSNALSEVITLTAGLGEAYTPTVIGPDGAVYAINNATLFCVGT